MLAAAPMWAPIQSPIYELPQSNSKSPVDFSPPLIAMVVVAAAAFLLVNYSRLISRHLSPPFRRITHWYRRRRSFPLPSDTDSLPPPYDDGFYVYSPYGLDDSVIKNLPLQIYKPLDLFELDQLRDCAVCLLEFEDGDYMRTLPHCRHSFHVDCIDMWLRAHATCPLCRSGAFFPSPLMASRIRPSLDEGVLTFLTPLPEQISGEIHEDLFSPEIQSEDHRGNRRELNMLLKRSYSFSFERTSFEAERGAATTPHHRRRSMWMKRPSSTPFSSIAKSRVFSLRTKSPGLMRRRGYRPRWESSGSMRYSGGWSRRMKSPVLGSRMRMGDPEALISPG